MASSDLPTSKDAAKPELDGAVETPRFSPEEEATLLSDSNAQKATANSLFTSAAYSEAIQAYDKALSSCPNYLDFEIAVLRANISACHLKLSEWKDAVSAATEALEHLDNLDPPPAGTHNDSKGKTGAQAPAVVEEVDDNTAARIEALQRSGRSRAEIQKLRAKALLRRAKARTELGSWAELAGADEDYKALAAMPELAPLDRRAVDAALRSLPARLDEAKNREMADMMGKLKDLGNGILKPFGLSTENFKFVKDEGTGGYSMQFNK